MTSVNHNNANGNDVATSPCTPLTPLTPTPRQHKRIAVVGAGSVGASVCYALLLRGIGAELLLVDIDRARCEGVC